ncbi:translocator protein [Pyrenophora tritici-repentis]|uniref:Translocator protein n=3 Tax=Pyrenophora tritici-repentis TaxID=45151 RepID=A0A2W1H1K0_9PLEO|nr:translocator protein [Pyrenophora tritici-repentis Pt-1C-BFP]KAA8617180.1 translocator protein [Pyrenophora tritici-repentis]EDU50449.1 translocator protein [Pyrenophora tritici-repentis Pt-1C-BFP]KAG9382160.1 translocator protein [Pyrenophora tritici-repentis]KAI1515222.1 translocator protein [Pyrenophora tritici-repentis]KAI1663745.1 translocator protein [Pyrenophora tritici-repentis]
MTSYIPSLTLPSFVFENPAVAILLPVVCGTATGFAISPSVSQVQYKTLKQPPLHPPGYVFGPVWTALYATMGYTAYRAYTTGASSANPHTVSLALHGATLYSIQLGLNLLWTPLYFGLGQPIAASVDILALGGTLAYLTSVWGQVDPVCGWLLAPYLGWVSFATYLCIGSGYLNNWDFKSIMKKD